MINNWLSNKDVNLKVNKKGLIINTLNENGIIEVYNNTNLDRNVCYEIKAKINFEELSNGNISIFAKSNNFETYSKIYNIKNKVKIKHKFFSPTFQDINLGIKFENLPHNYEIKLYLFQIHVVENVEQNFNKILLKNNDDNNILSYIEFQQYHYFNNDIAKQPLWEELEEDDLEEELYFKLLNINEPYLESIINNELNFEEYFDNKMYIDKDGIVREIFDDENTESCSEDGDINLINIEEELDYEIEKDVYKNSSYISSEDEMLFLDMNNNENDMIEIEEDNNDILEREKQWYGPFWEDIETINISHKELLNILNNNLNDLNEYEYYDKWEGLLDIKYEEPFLEDIDDINFWKLDVIMKNFIDNLSEDSDSSDYTSSETSESNESLYSMNEILIINSEETDSEETDNDVDIKSVESSILIKSDLDITEDEVIFSDEDNFVNSEEESSIMELIISDKESIIDNCSIGEINYDNHNTEYDDDYEEEIIIENILESDNEFEDNYKLWELKRYGNLEQIKLEMLNDFWEIELSEMKLDNSLEFGTIYFLDESKEKDVYYCENNEEEYLQIDKYEEEDEIENIDDKISQVLEINDNKLNISSDIENIEYENKKLETIILNNIDNTCSYFEEEEKDNIINEISDNIEIVENNSIKTEEKFNNEYYVENKEEIDNNIITEEELYVVESDLGEKSKININEIMLSITETETDDFDEIKDEGLESDLEENEELLEDNKIINNIERDNIGCIINNASSDEIEKEDELEDEINNVIKYEIDIEETNEEKNEFDIETEYSNKTSEDEIEREYLEIENYKVLEMEDENNEKIVEENNYISEENNYISEGSNNKSEESDFDNENIDNKLDYKEDEFSDNDNNETNKGGNSNKIVYEEEYDNLELLPIYLLPEEEVENYAEDPIGSILDDNLDEEKILNDIFELEEYNEKIRQEKMKPNIFILDLVESNKKLRKYNTNLIIYVDDYFDYEGEKIFKNIYKNYSDNDFDMIFVTENVLKRNNIMNNGDENFEYFDNTNLYEFVSTEFEYLEKYDKVIIYIFSINNIKIIKKLNDLIEDKNILILSDIKMKIKSKYKNMKICSRNIVVGNEINNIYLPPPILNNIEKEFDEKEDNINIYIPFIPRIYLDKIKYIINKNRDINFYIDNDNPKIEYSNIEYIDYKSGMSNIFKKTDIVIILKERSLIKIKAMVYKCVLLINGDNIVEKFKIGINFHDKNFINKFNVLLESYRNFIDNYENRSLFAYLENWTVDKFFYKIEDLA